MTSKNYFRQGSFIVFIFTIVVTTFIFVEELNPASDNHVIFVPPYKEDLGDRKDKVLPSVKNHSRDAARLWPDQDDGDRIVEQMAFIPHNLGEITNNGTKLKLILLHTRSNLYISGTTSGQQPFLEDNCPVKTCRITSNYDEFPAADAVIFTDETGLPKVRLNAEQIWVLHLLESPFNSPQLTTQKVFNWTMTYRTDSDVPNPYGKFFLYDPSVIYKPQSINYAANKTKKVAWFVSNCHASNKRLQYVLELNKFIDVHTFGGCVRKSFSCPRSKSNDCNLMLKKDYKFYLSFENSNCKYYITEKFFYNALGNDVLPIVMGARKEDYEMAAPYHSFIHVDDFESPKDLADYLHILDKNDTLYNEYFQWKGTGQFSKHLNAHFWCRFCAMLHSKIPHKTYQDTNKWWRGTGTCTRDSWTYKKKLLWTEKLGRSFM